MDDLLLKYAMIVVGVVVFTLLLTYAFTALKANPIPEEKFQNYYQTPKNAVNYFTRLCEMCLGQENYERECFVIDYYNPGPNNLTNVMFQNLFNRVQINLSNNLPRGKFTIKVMSVNNTCVLDEIDRQVAPVQTICQLAATNGLCPGLDIAYYIGYKSACCTFYGLCC